MSRQFWAGKNVVVTGGLGLVGSHFAEQLLASGATVTLPYRRDNRRVLARLPRSGRLRPVRLDLLDTPMLTALFDSFDRPVDLLVHAAALTGPKDSRVTKPGNILDTNMQVVSNILNCARDFAVPDVVLLSSGDIYLAPDTDPIQEEDDFKKRMHYSRDGYYLSKTYTEVLAEAYRAEYGINIFLPRPASLYGPRDNFEVDTDRVVPTMFAKALAGQEIEVWGDGSQTRTYMHAADSVLAILDMVEANKHYVLNVATTETVSVVSLARMICAALGQPERIRFDPTKSGGRPTRTLDVTKLNDVITFAPRSLREGLDDTVEWYRTVAPRGIPQRSLTIPAG